MNSRILLSVHLIECYTNFLGTYQNVTVLYLVYQRQIDDFKSGIQVWMKE